MKPTGGSRASIVVVAAAAAFMKVAELAPLSGGSPAQWIERAYAENPGDSEIALAYSKNLLEQGQVGAAIFVLEQQVNAGGATSEELRQMYAKALVGANRLTDAEPVIWTLYGPGTVGIPLRVAEVAPGENRTERASSWPARLIARQSSG